MKCPSTKSQPKELKRQLLPLKRQLRPLTSQLRNHEKPTKTTQHHLRTGWDPPSSTVPTERRLFNLGTGTMATRQQRGNVDFKWGFPQERERKGIGKLRSPPKKGTHTSSGNKNILACFRQVTKWKKPPIAKGGTQLYARSRPC